MAEHISTTHLTQEQSLIVGYNGHKLVIKAYAGTGKTYTLTQYALAHPELRMLYIAYNRAIREEAEAKFPSNVTCRTSHQLAYHVIGKQYRHKLAPNLRLRDVADATGTPSWGVANDILSTVQTFLVSPDRKLGSDHFSTGQGQASNPASSKKGARKTRRGKEASADKPPQEGYRKLVVDKARRLWLRMIDLDDAFPATHDTYCKLYQLSQPDLSDSFDLVMVDEAQDLVPVVTALVTNQACRILAVGDSNQQIYAFRGARNSLDARAFKDAEVRYLTQSFRFGTAVAQVANALLSFKGETRPVVGLGGQDRAIPSSDFNLKSHQGPVTFMARTVMGVIQMALFFARHGIKVNMVGGPEAYNLDHIENLYWLSRQDKTRVKDKRLLAEFEAYGDYVTMAEDSNDPEMLRAVKVIEAFPALPKDLALLRQQTVGDPGAAPVTVTTAHRAKGLEWDTVYLCDDFPDIFDNDMPPDTRGQEVNLLYVAATRAMRLLVFNDLVATALKRARPSGEAARVSA